MKIHIISHSVIEHDNPRSAMEMAVEQLDHINETTDPDVMVFTGELSDAPLETRDVIAYIKEPKA